MVSFHRPSLAALAAALSLTVAGGATASDAKRDAAAAQALLAKAQAAGSVGVIVTLRRPEEAPPADEGRVNLNAYVANLQTQAMKQLGWVNFNDLVRFNYTPAMAMSVDAQRLQQLVASNAVAGVYEDAEMKAFLADSVPLIGAPSIWKGGATGKGISVAVVDTGVDRNHPFLNGKVVAEACFSMGPAQTQQGTVKPACPSGQPTQIGTGAGMDCPAEYGCGHGTHVAGIVAGRGDSFTGAAPDANIVAVQVFSLLEGPGCGGGKCNTASLRSVIQGLEWVYENRAQHNIKVVNMSLGGGEFKGDCDAQSPVTPMVRLLHEAGVAVVVASGNDGKTDAMSQPACISMSISVGASDVADGVAEFSNSSSSLDLLAPGIDHIPLARGRGINSAVPGGQFKRMPGTSMAAPHVAGAIAAMREAAPNPSVDQLLAALKQSGVAVRDGRNGLTVSRIQIDKALAALGGGTPAPQPQPQPQPQPKPEPPQAGQPQPQPEPPQAQPAPPPKQEGPRNVGGIRIYDGRSGAGDKMRW